MFSQITELGLLEKNQFYYGKHGFFCKKLNYVIWLNIGVGQECWSDLLGRILNKHGWGCQPKIQNKFGILTLTWGLSGKCCPKILIKPFSSERVGFDLQKSYVNLRLYKYFNYWALSWQSMSSIVHNLENSLSIRQSNRKMLLLLTSIWQIKLLLLGQIDNTWRFPMGP